MKLIFKILTAPVVLVIDLFTLICIGMISFSGMLLRLVSGIIAILGVAVLATYSPKNGLILLTIAFLFSPMENCSCKEDPQKDGCYHCLFAYRQNQQIGNISRSAAIRMLKSILSGKDNIEKINKLNDIPVNPLFDSELEQRFMEAIRLKVGAANVSDTIRNGKHSYACNIEVFCCC